MKYLFFALSFYFIFSINNSISAQVADDEFIAELNNLYHNIENKEEKKSALIILNEFSAQWQSGKYDDRSKKSIISTYFLLVKKKMKPVPHLFLYLKCLNQIKENSSYITPSFLQSIEYILSEARKVKHLDSYFETFISTVKDNILISSTTTQWKTNKTFEKFVFDSVPYFTYKNINLTCYANKDSSTIFNTDGYFYPLDLRWKAVNGIIKWQKAGLSSDSVFASAGLYSINLKSHKYSMDSVLLTNKAFFKKPILGSLENKLIADVKEENVTYPRFDSYDKQILIINLFKDIDYQGGFSQHGAKLLGTGDKNHNAMLILKRHKKKDDIQHTENIIGRRNYFNLKEDSAYIFIILDSKVFSIYKDRIAAERSAVTLYYGDDSIYHPGLRMKFISKSRELSLLRYEEGLTQSPYFNTYHKVDMYFEAFTWKMDDKKIDLAMIKGPGSSSEANFQSFNYFTVDKFHKIQGLDEVNPLFEIKDYCTKNKTKEFFLDEYSRFIRKSVTTTKPLLLTLANMGFLVYDLDNEKITVKDRLFYYLSAKTKKTDYDVIEFNSLITGKAPNATLNLENFNLTIRGVNRVSLSDSQKVYIFPLTKEVVLKQNRDFSFSGRVHAGMFDFYGKEFGFDYDKFKLDLPKVDSLTFYVKSFKKDDKGQYRYVKVKSIIQDISGDLLLDQPKNKSGLKKYPGFPILNSKSESYVFYHKQFIQGGVYDKEKFFYKIDPFSIDSLANFKTENLEFKGTLVSGGIFPDIQEPLKVQPDYSLGFVKATPSEGFPVYGGKGVFSQYINLSNTGLKGNGTLNYLSSVSKSEEFLFLPDSMNAIVKNFELSEQTTGIEYPQVTGANVYQHWLPYKNQMMIASKSSAGNNPIEMYNKQSSLFGKLYLSPSELKGNGKMDFIDAEMTSNLFKFKNQSFDCDSADFSMKSIEQKEIAFQTHNYKAHVDYTARRGNFISNGSGSKVEFPVNQYICYMDEFEWYMDKDELALSDSKNRNQNLDNLTLKQLIEIDLTGSKFISINPNQDSLQFFSPKAKYNLKQNIIYAQGVRIIKIADAAIFPDNGDVTVLKKAEMKTLEKATIIANTTTEYHTIYDALVKITSRRKYTAKGTYEYVMANGTKEAIFLDNIAVDSTFQTYASGNIPTRSVANNNVPDSLASTETPSLENSPEQNENQFYLSEAFSFKGKVKLIASREYLTFDGAAKIVNSCSLFSLSDSLEENSQSKVFNQNSIAFTLEINPNDIYIPIPEKPLNSRKKPILAGMFFSNDTAGVYSRFLQPFNPDEDLPSTYVLKDSVMINAMGYLHYDSFSREYRIASKEKLKTSTLPGNYFSLNNEKCIIQAEGKFRFGSDLGRMQFDAYGSSKHYIIPDSTIFDLSIISDFFFNESALEILSTSLTQNPALKPVDLNSEKFTKTLYEIFGTLEADKIISEMNIGIGLKKMPEEIKKTFFMTDIKMQWFPSVRSFVSKGKIGIANFNSQQINKYVDGYVVVKKRRTGDVLSIYIKPSQTEWFLFDYDCRKKLLSAISSNKDFNTAVSTAKADSRKLKSKGEKDSYSYYISTDHRRNEFLQMISEIE